jgi:hypothetical protein
MGHDGGLGPLLADDPAAEAFGSSADSLLRFLGRRPPGIRQMVEPEIRPAGTKLGDGRADVAGEKEAFGDKWFDSNRQIEVLGDDHRSLESSNVRAGNQPG